MLPSGFFRTVQAPWSTQTCSRSSAYAQKLHRLNVPLLLTNHKHLIPYPSFFFQRLEANVVGFVRTELKRFQEMLAPSHSDVLESRGADEDERRSSEAVLKITLDFLRRMEQDELSHLLQTSTFLKMLRSPGALGPSG